MESTIGQQAESTPFRGEGEQKVQDLFDYFGFAYDPQKKYEVVIPMNVNGSTRFLKQSFSYDELVQKIAHLTNSELSEGDEYAAYCKKVEDEYTQGQAFLEKQLAKISKEELYERYGASEIKKKLLDPALPAETIDSLAGLIAKEQTPGTKLQNETGEREVVQETVSPTTKKENTTAPLEESREKMVEKLFYTLGIVYALNGTYDGLVTPFVYSEGKVPDDFNQSNSPYLIEARFLYETSPNYLVHPVELKNIHSKTALGIYFRQPDQFRRHGFVMLSALFEKDNQDVKKQLREDPQLLVDIFNTYFAKKTFVQGYGAKSLHVIPVGEKLTLATKEYTAQKVYWVKDRANN